jgi:pilus assembly protein CpaF
MTTLQFARNGEPPRLFRFSEPKVSIGAAAHCLLRLEDSPKGETTVCTIALSNGIPIVRGSAEDSCFRLNGRPIGLANQPIGVGDTITAGPNQIVVKGLPGIDAPGRRATERPPEIRQEDEAATRAIDPDEASAAAHIAPEVEPATHAATAATVAFVPPTSAPDSAPEISAPESKAKASPRTSTGQDLSYLYLFFAPVKQYLEDDDVSEVMINGPRQIYVERKGRLEATKAAFPNEQSLQAAVINVARTVGRFFNSDNPRLDARLPDGSRVHAVMPPLSRLGTSVAIRKFRRERLTLSQLIQYGSISAQGAKLLEVIVGLGKNLLVSGATSSGKTSVLNVLSALIPPNQRILVLEDASELQLQQTHVLPFETRKADEYGKGEVTIRELLHSSLRLRPDRIVVGEIRGGEALDLLQAMNTGHDGSMSTIHANSARDSLFRLETCALLSGVELPLSALREQVASAIHVVVQTSRLPDGSRKITSISEVLGLRGGEYQLQDLLVYAAESRDAAGRLGGQHRFTGQQPTFSETAKRNGFDLVNILPTA